MAELLSLVTGEEWSTEELKETGIRVLNIARAFNQREGFDAKDDTAPKRVFREMIKNGPAAGQKIPESVFEDMKQQYYGYMGWSAKGIVPQTIIEKL
ncbi:MAG: aldehyde ferredoxin oxidoreductase C-terminal domain-containing protein [Eubacterium sp.]